MSDNIWIVILAAGQSTRMGRPKQLLSIEGNAMIRHIALKALLVVNAQVAIVGNENPEVKQQCSDLPLSWIDNYQSNLGLSSSITAGVRFAWQEQARAIVFLLGDQPDLETQVIEQVIAAYRHTGKTIVQALYKDRPSHPVLFDRALFSELLLLRGDNGAKPLLKLYQKGILLVAVNGVTPIDLDTPEDYAAYRKED